jgi:predicted nucleic acid-binding protein
MPVVDASVAVDWLAPESDPDGSAMRALRRMVAAGLPVRAPTLMWQEVANALLSGVRRGRWDGAAADGAFTLLRDLPVERADDPSDLARAWDLARRYDEHPVYDLCYLAVAARTGDILLTADERLLGRLVDRRDVVRPDDWA